MLLMLASCALVTKQKDFEVDLPLFEDSEQDAVQPAELPMELKLYDSRTSWLMPAFLDNEDWGAVLLADAALRDAGRDGLLAVEVTALSLDVTGSVDVRFAMTSPDTRRFLLRESGVTAPEACLIRVADDTPPAAFGDALRGCLEAWVDTNGAPADPRLEAEVVATDLERYALAIDFTVTTDRTVDRYCSDWLVVDDELRAEADHVDIGTLDLAGYVVSSQSAMDLVAFQNTFPLETGDPNAGGITVVALEGAGGSFVGQEIEIVDPLPAGVTVSGVAPIDYFPDRDTWLARSTAALETVEGYVQACWVAAHAEPGNTPLVHVTLVGEGHYDGRE